MKKIKRWKIVSILLAVLALGFLVGFLTAGFFTRKRVKRFVRFRTAEGFEQHIREIIRPTDTQEVLFEEIIQRYATQHADLHKEFVKDVRTLMYNFEQEIKPVLDEAQWTRLQERGRKYRKRKHKKWRREKSNKQCD